MTPLPRSALPLPDSRPEVLRAIMRSFDPETPPSSTRVRELALCSPGRLSAAEPRRHPAAGRSGCSPARP